MSTSYGIMQTSNLRHKVFVSYHHLRDQAYRDSFEYMFAYVNDIMVVRSVQIGDLDPNLKTETIRQKIRDEYLRDSAVTVVLIGAETWKRKHVDWEVAASIRHTLYNPRSGLLGIILPTYPRTDQKIYNPYTIPPRLYDNIKCRFAEIYNWSNDATIVQNWIHEAFERRNKVNPDNTRTLFANNRSGGRWQE
jgi:hypothetical protein